MQGIATAPSHPDVQPDVQSLEFDPAEIRRRYAGAFRPKAWIYWTDLMISAGLGWSAFGVALTAGFGTPLYIAAVVVATFALLRGALFIHELAHLTADQLPGFELAWHLVIGLPLQLPSLMYVGSHNDHHKRRAFGTRADPEYAPIAHWPRWRIVLFVLGVAFLPIVLPLRWAVAAPLSYFIPPLRRLCVERASTLVINPDYRRPMPKGTQVQRWMRQELGAGAVFWAACLGLWLGLIPLLVVPTWLIIASGILVINQIRTLAAHRYENEGEEVDPEGQLMDSINLRGVPVLTALVAPVGLRYHALHHFLPAVPYHSLGTLHRKLARELPTEAVYHRTEGRGILATVRELWQKAPA